MIERKKNTLTLFFSFMNDNVCRVIIELNKKLKRMKNKNKKNTLDWTRDRSTSTKLERIKRLLMENLIFYFFLALNIDPHVYVNTCM